MRTLHVLSVSDTHGWIYGHRHEPEVGNYGLLVSYIERMHEKVANDTSSDVLAIDGGDIIEGTGLSDRTKIRGELIYEIAARVPFDLLTLGNHDMDNADSSQFLSENSEALFGDKFISTNTFRNSDNQPLIQHSYKYFTLKNGLRLLVFSFLFSGPKYEYGHTKSSSRIIKSNIVQDVLDSYKYNVDILLINNHMASHSQEWEEIYTAFRSYYDDQNYTIPLLFLASHSHIITNQNCPFENARQCYIVEAGCYLKHLQHITYSFEDITYENGNSTYTGVQIININPNLPTDFTYANTARRLDQPEDLLLTANGIAVQNGIDELVAKMKLESVIGYSPHDYELMPPYDSPDSMFYLWARRVVPTQLFPLSVFNNTCTPIVISISNFFRETLHYGDITLDDTSVIFPFRYTLNYLNNITYNELFCVVDYMNNNIEGSRGSPLIILEERRDEMDTNACYNTILTSYESQYLVLVIGPGGPCHKIIDPSKSYLPNAILAERDLSDEIKAGDNFTMGELFRSYIEHAMPPQDHSTANTYFFLPLIVAGSLFGITILVAIILLVIFIVRRNRRASNIGINAKDENKALVYDSDTITTESVTANSDQED